MGPKRFSILFKVIPAGSDMASPFGLHSSIRVKLHIFMFDWSFAPFQARGGAAMRFSHQRRSGSAGFLIGVET